MLNKMTLPKEVPAWLLRLGLAFAFMYAGVAALANPGEWIGYLPGFLAEQSSAETLLKVFSIYQILLALWLLSGWYLRYAALLSAATLAGVVAANLDLLIVTFRDIALLFAALALTAIGFSDRPDR